MSKGIPAIVLAAGASQRLGQAKALVNWNGETLVRRAVRLLKETGCNPVIVVTRIELQVDIMLECPEHSNCGKSVSRRWKDRLFTGRAGFFD